MFRSTRVVSIFGLALFLFIGLAFQNCGQKFQSGIEGAVQNASTDVNQPSGDSDTTHPPSNEDPVVEVPGSKVIAPQSILFIGNSFTYTSDRQPYNNLPELIRNLFLSANLNVEIQRDTFPDAYFRTHLDRASVLENINSKRYEAVVFQGHSTEAENSVNMQRYGTQLIQLARAAQATPVLFMTWNRADRPVSTFTDSIRVQYEKLGKDTSTAVAPVGLAWEIFKNANPTINLYVDNRHPNAIGSYIAAVTFYSFFTGKTPIGLAYKGELNSVDAEAAQSAAWQAITQYNQFYLKTK